MKNYYLFTFTENNGEYEYPYNKVIIAKSIEDAELKARRYFYSFYGSPSSVQLPDTVYFNNEEIMLRYEYVDGPMTKIEIENKLLNNETIRTACTDNTVVDFETECEICGREHKISEMLYRMEVKTGVCHKPIVTYICNECKDHPELQDYYDNGEIMCDPKNSCKKGNCLICMLLQFGGKK